MSRFYHCRMSKDRDLPILFLNIFYPKFSKGTSNFLTFGSACGWSHPLPGARGWSPFPVPHRLSPWMKHKVYNKLKHNLHVLLRKSVTNLYGEKICDLVGKKRATFLECFSDAIWVQIGWILQKLYPLLTPKLPTSHYTTFNKLKFQPSLSVYFYHRYRIKSRFGLCLFLSRILSQN